MESGELEPDFGPAEPHPSAGATLVTARPPLVAFNVELDTPEPRGRARDRRRAARGGRRAARGAGDRPAARGRAHARSRPTSTTRSAVPLGEVVAEIERLAAEHGARPVEAELVGLVPEAALEGYPDDAADPGLRPEA